MPRNFKIAMLMLKHDKPNELDKDYVKGNYGSTFLELNKAKATEFEFNKEAGKPKVLMGGDYTFDDWIPKEVSAQA